MSDGDRAQDVGRSHHRAGTIAPETAEILERYRDAMRLELADTLEEIRPAVGQQGFDGTVVRPTLEIRKTLWDLAIKLGRELGAGGGDRGLEDAPSATVASQAPGRGRAPRLSKRDRASIG